MPKGLFVDLVAMAKKTVTFMSVFFLVAVSAMPLAALCVQQCRMKASKSSDKIHSMECCGDKSPQSSLLRELPGCVCPATANRPLQSEPGSGRFSLSPQVVHSDGAESSSSFFLPTPNFRRLWHSLPEAGGVASKDLCLLNSVLRF